MARARRRIIGIDPGTEVAGFCILDFDTDSGKDVRLLDVGVIRVEGRRHFRLWWLHEKLVELFSKHKGVALDVVVERAFVFKNPSTAIVIGEARGVVLAAAGGLEDARLYDVSPMEAKKSVGGRGDASKYTVAAAAKAILGIDEELPLDATDAASIALHHYLKGRRWAEALEE